MNKQANLVDWAELINNYRASGQSMSSWCQANNLKVHQLTYQLQKEKRTKTRETTKCALDNLARDKSLTALSVENQRLATFTSA